MAATLTLQGELWSATIEEFLADFGNRGVDAFADLDGEFAIRLKISDNEFFLIRDPIGAHPLYFRDDRPDLFSALIAEIAPTSLKKHPIGSESCFRRDQNPAEEFYASPISGVSVLAPG